MCGICGMVAAGPMNRQALSNSVENMRAVLRHRGPDDGGDWVDEAAGVGLGHRRLSILDLSPAGHQPMVSASRRYVIVFNGEVYNAPQIRVELESEFGPRKWRGTSDTEVVLESIAAWGVMAAVSRFNGMFAMAVWDRTTRTLAFIRDRFGVKPLYLARDLGGNLLFASEVKAIAAMPGFAARLNPESLGAFLDFGYVPAVAPIYADTAVLPPGTILTVTAGGAVEWKALQDFTRQRPAGAARGEGWSAEYYWSAAEIYARGQASTFSGTQNGAENELVELLRDAVRMRMVSDVPLGSFLSGGVDSSLVTAMMRETSSGAVRTFGIGFPDAEFDESRYAREVARHLGTDHHEFVVSGQDCLDVAHRLHELQDEPLGDSSFIPTYLVSKTTRAHVTVAMTGDGGDEFFGGYWRYRQFQRLAGVFALPSSFRTCWSGLAQALTINPVGRRHPLWAWYRFGRLARLCAHQDFAAAYRYAVTTGASSDLLNVPKRIGDFKLPGALNSTSLSEQMMWLDVTHYLPDDLLVKVDRASMRVSLECREPLLDYRIYEFAARIPIAWKLGPGGGKLMLRNLLRRYLPAELVDRKKQGFAIPLAAWLRTDLREWARERLFASQPASDGFFRLDIIQRLWDEHQTGRRDHKTVLWHLVVLRQWLATNRWT